MKLIYSAITLCYLILISPRAMSREVILIENLATTAEGELLTNILVKKFNIPRELITLKNTNGPCEAKSEAIVHLCLDAEGELQIRRINHYVVKNSLGVFLNQKNEQE